MTNIIINNISKSKLYFYYKYYKKTKEKMVDSFYKTTNIKDEYKFDSILGE